MGREKKTVDIQSLLDRTVPSETARRHLIEGVRGDDLKSMKTHTDLGEHAVGEVDHQSSR